MSGTAHIATLNAYPRKEELGGGFRGVFIVHATETHVRQRRQSEVFPTLEAARHWCKVQAEDTYAEQGYLLAPVRRKGEYCANVWVAV
jgi:hypothetical protein